MIAAFLTMENATNIFYFFSHQKYKKKWKKNYFQQQYFLRLERLGLENIETYQTILILLCLPKNQMEFILISMIKKLKNIYIVFI